MNMKFIYRLLLKSVVKVYSHYKHKSARKIAIKIVRRRRKQMGLRFALESMAVTVIKRPHLLLARPHLR